MTVESPRRLENGEIPARPHEHSPAMGIRMLSGDIDGNGQKSIGDQIDSDVVDIYYQGHLINRGEYWKEKGVQKFGQQMQAWLPSTATFLEKAKDTDEGKLMREILKKSGIIGNESTVQDSLKSNKSLQALVERINSDLPANTLDLQTMDDTTREILGFYNYSLAPQKNAEGQRDQVRDLVEDLAEGIIYEDINSKKLYDPYTIRKRLAAMAPFLRVAGLEGQHGLSAMLSAQVDYFTKDEHELRNVDRTQINDADRRSLDFFKKHQDTVSGIRSDETSEDWEHFGFGDYEAYEIVPSQDLIDRFRSVPTFKLSDIDDLAQYNLADTQKATIRDTWSKIRLVRPVMTTLDVDDQLVSEVVHGKGFFSHHTEIVPLVHAFSHDSPPPGKGGDQNETINQGESIFNGHQDFVTGIAAFMGSEIEDPQLRAQTQASAALALADAILQVYERSEDAFDKLLKTQLSLQHSPRDYYTYQLHDLARHFGIDIQSDGGNGLQEKIDTLPLGVITPPEETNTLFVWKKTEEHNIMLDKEATAKKLHERYQKVSQELEENTLTPEGAMLIEFLGNGLYVQKLAEAIAAKQKAEQTQAAAASGGEPPTPPANQESPSPRETSQPPQTSGQSATTFAATSLESYAPTAVQAQTANPLTAAGTLGTPSGAPSVEPAPTSFVPPTQDELEATARRSEDAVEIPQEIRKRIEDVAEERAYDLLGRRNAYLRALVEKNREMAQQLVAYAVGAREGDEGDVGAYKYVFDANTVEFPKSGIQNLSLLDFTIPTWLANEDEILERYAIPMSEDQGEQKFSRFVRQSIEETFVQRAKEKMHTDFAPALQQMGVEFQDELMAVALASQGQLSPDKVQQLLQLRMNPPEGFTYNGKGREIAWEITNNMLTIRPEYVDTIAAFINKLPAQMDQLYMIVLVYQKLQELFERKSRYTPPGPDVPPAGGAVAIVQQIRRLPKELQSLGELFPDDPSEPPSDGEGPGADTEETENPRASQSSGWYAQEQRREEYNSSKKMVGQ